MVWNSHRITEMIKRRRNCASEEAEKTLLLFHQEWNLDVDLTITPVGIDRGEEFGWERTNALPRQA